MSVLGGITRRFYWYVYIYLASGLFMCFVLFFFVCRLLLHVVCFCLMRPCFFSVRFRVYLWLHVCFVIVLVVLEDFAIFVCNILIIFHIIIICFFCCSSVGCYCMLFDSV